AEAVARDLVDAVALRPGGLFQLQPAEIDVEFVARLLQPAGLDKQHAVAMARVHHRQRRGDVGDDQHGQQQARGHAASCSAGFSATRSTALRARGLAAVSASSAFCAPPIASRSGVKAISTGMRRLAGGALAWRLMNCLTMRSSSEWKLITASRPPGLRRSSAASSPAS